jgi:HAD superfamily hydrolase (TIGR01490 family)
LTPPGPRAINPTAVAASYFDVDGTLVRTNLVHPTLYYLMHQRTPFRSLQKVARAAFRSPQLAWAEMQDRRMFNEMLFAAYEGISQDRLLLLADDAFDSVLRRALYPSAKDLVSRCRDEGHDVVLVSGALDFLMKRLADHLGATHVIANRLEIKDGFATGRLLRPVVAGPEKARLIRDHAREQGHDLDECFAYSDSYSDVPMLSVVGHPAAVNPDGKLQRLARTYGWPVLTLDKAAS